MNRTQVEERLHRAAETGTFSHAYILEGLAGGAKGQLAESFGKMICREAIIRLQADGLSIRDDDVEQMQIRLAKKPFIGERNVAIVENADTMTLRAQNRLLKTLEEPPGHGVILLLSENSENLLPTILSRCILYRLDEEGTQSDGSSEPALRAAVEVGAMLLENRPFYQMNRALTEVLSGRDKAYAFLDALESWYRDLVLLSLPGSGESWIPGWSRGDCQEEANDLRLAELRRCKGLVRREEAYQAVACIEEARRDLNRNINTGYALKGMLLQIMG